MRQDCGQPKGFPPAGKLREAVMRGYFKEKNYRGFGSPSSVTHGFAVRATFPAKGEGLGRRQPKGFPLAGKLREAVMRGFIIIVSFMIFKPFKLPILLEAGICLAGGRLPVAQRL